MDSFTQKFRINGFLPTKVIFFPFILLLLTMCQLSLAAPSHQGAERSSRIHQLQAALLAHPERSSDITTLILSDRSNKQSLAGAITSAGIKIQRHSKGLYQVRMPAGKVKAFLDKMPQLVSARLPYPHSSNTVTSQGVDLTGAADMQQLTFDGTGVKIGIIDLGFTSLATSQAAGELPATGAGLSIIDYSGTGTGGTNHGTNVAEIVHDMAPGAELYLAKIATTLDLEAAVNDMIASGVQVINHSVGWYGAAFYDGTGSLCDITATADSANIIWANAAGNARNEHYLGTFTDTDDDLFHEFASEQNYNTISATAGAIYTFVLNWDDYAANRPEDYDLFVYNGDPNAGGAVIASSTNSQATNYPWPYEAVSYIAPATEINYIVVKKRSSTTTNLPLTLFSLGKALDTRTRSSSLTQPADCSTVLTVGATDLVDAAEWFSSEGPTTDGRDKPEISGPDRNVTSLSASFAGTSSSSPHVAGAVAQLIQQNPGLNKTQIQDLLISTSHDVSTIGFDYRTGFGRFSLDADSDSINHDNDNCLLDYNLDQLDTDLDLAGNVCDADDDNDGLTDVFEATIGSDPLLVDTDGDTLSDYDEIAYDGDASNFNINTDLNPLLIDTDSDLLSDADEIYIYGTSPLSSNIGDMAPYGAPDGNINISDLMILYRIISGHDILTTYELTVGDIDHNGILDVRDALLLRQNLEI